MTAPFTNTTEVTQVFDGSQASNILHKAIAQQVHVQIEMDCDQQVVVVNGELSENEDAGMIIQLHDDSELNGKEFSQKDIRVFFEISGNRYVFELKVAPLNCDDDAAALIVEKPKTVCLVERRRTVRRRLRQPTVVHLACIESDGDWKGRATMLNASEHGLACRIEKLDGNKLKPGQILNVEFHLGGESDSFKMKASIINMTGGGSEDQVILGMEFSEGYEFDMERDRLRNALRTTM